MHGSYDSLVSGLGIESLSTLTGMPCRPIQLQPDVSGHVECDQNIWTKIESAHNAKFVLISINISVIVLISFKILVT